MAPRVTQLKTKDDYPYDLSTDEARDRLDATFAALESYIGVWPGLYGDGPIVPNAWGQIFHVPGFAKGVIDLAQFIVHEMPWSQRANLRELAIMALYERQRCDYAYRSHIPAADAAGVSAEQIAELPVYRSSEAFDDEERDVIEFTHAALDNHVSDELAGRLKDRYGEQGLVEMTAVVSFWALWGIVINVLQPDYMAPRLPE